MNSLVDLIARGDAIANSVPKCNPERSKYLTDIRGHFSNSFEVQLNANRGHQTLGVGGAYLQYGTMNLG